MVRRRHDTPVTRYSYIAYCSVRTKYVPVRPGSPLPLNLVGLSHLVLRIHTVCRARLVNTPDYYFRVAFYTKCCSKGDNGIIKEIWLVGPVFTALSIVNVCLISFPSIMMPTSPVKCTTRIYLRSHAHCLNRTQSVSTQFLFQHMTNNNRKL